MREQGDPTQTVPPLSDSRPAAPSGAPTLPGHWLGPFQEAAQHVTATLWPQIFSRIACLSSLGLCTDVSFAVKVHEVPDHLKQNCNNCPFVTYSIAVP